MNFKNIIQSTCILSLCLSCSPLQLSLTLPSSPPTQTAATPPETQNLGKMAVKFNLPQDITVIEPGGLTNGDFIESALTPSFHTLASVADIASIRLKISSPKLPQPLTQTIGKDQLNSNKRIVIENLPVGPTQVTVELLDKNAAGLATETKQVSIVAAQITLVEFNLTLVNDPRANNPQTGALGITINVKEETPLFAQLEVPQTRIRLSEMLTIRLVDIQGEVTSYQFNLGDGTGEKTTTNPSLSYQFTKPGRFMLQARLLGAGEKKYVTDPVYIVVEGDNTSPSPEPSIAPQPPVSSATVTSNLPQGPIGPTVSTLAGSGEAGYADGTHAKAQFNHPYGIAIDGNGNIYVADQLNNRIRKMTLDGSVITLAGKETAGKANRSGTYAEFYDPRGVAVDGNGNVYVADYGNGQIRKITPTGRVTFLAGGFNYPIGVAVDGNGNIYIADMGHNKIWKATENDKPGLFAQLSLFAGDGTCGSTDGKENIAKFCSPAGITADRSGNIFVTDYNNHRIRKISPSGVVSTLAGSGTPGFSDGNGASAKFNNPAGVAVDKSGNVYVADRGNNRIRKITAVGEVSTLAGNGIGGLNDGSAASAGFNNPTGVAVDGNGNVYVADYKNNRIRKIAQ